MYIVCQENKNNLTKILRCVNYTPKDKSQEFSWDLSFLLLMCFDCHRIIVEKLPINVICYNVNELTYNPMCGTL